MLSRRRRTALLAAAVVLLLLLGGRAAAEFVEQLLWYQSLGREGLFWTRWYAGAAVRVLVGAGVAAIVGANLWAVTRTLGAIRVRRRYANLEIAERLPQSYAVTVVLSLALLSGWWLSGAFADPIPVLAAASRVTWGIADPVFGRDLSYHVFVLPVLERLQALAGLVVAWTGLLVVSSYLATGAIKVDNGRLSVGVFARRHLGVLAGLFLLTAAWDLWLDRYGLLFDGHGVGAAVGYTDVHARMPALAVTALLSALLAPVVGYAAWRGRRGYALAAAALLLTAHLIGRVAYPALLQKLAVEPNEFRRERPYIERHLRFTRLGYDLDAVRTVRLPYRPSAPLSDSALMRALARVPLWDPRPLLEVYRQRQSLFRYYDFHSVHPDRYAGDQVAVAVRELDPTQLPEAARTWQNLHLNYVSGDGAVATAMSRMGADGSPTYYLQDLDPPRLAPGAPPQLALQDTRVFFGERMTGYVVTDSAGGPRGVPLTSAWRRMVFAWGFQSKNLLLSGNVTGASRIVFRRALTERVHALAPFLTLLPEEGALPVVHRGRIVWLVDAFTTTDRFPLSRAAAFAGRRVRYVRNSVKATVDAVTGEVAFYVVDPSDPLIVTYGRLFPGLLRPVAEMPAELRSHLRYSGPLLQMEADVVADYHLLNPERFYAREDVWAVATQKYRDDEQRMEPVYSTMALPGEREAEFLLSLPMVAQGRPNLAALLVARNDGARYGERLLFELPRDVQVPGPQQVEAQIDQDPEISQQLSLWKEGGSQVIRGNLLVVPVDSTLVYLEPLFLEAAQQPAIPQLERVILAAGGSVVMRPTLPGAITALAAPGSEPPPRGAAPAPTPAGGGDALLAEARRLLDRAEARLREGDWAGFGEAWRALRDLLRGAGGAGGS